MSQVQKAVEDLITAVKECEEYHRYQKAREKMFQYPVLKEKADEFRRLNYDFQCNGTNHFEESDRLSQEFAYVLEHPVVWEYLMAENAVCRILRQVNWDLLQNLDFELDF